MKIKIDKIIVKDNVRKDAGDLTDLKNSVLEVGIRVPLELNRDLELIDGHRRLRAAKAAGLTEIPVYYSDDSISKIESQIIAGIHQKNLNPIEEAKAFYNYLKEGIVSELINKTGKSGDYIQRRLDLLDSDVEVKEALTKGKIEIGHAVVLSKLDDNRQKKLLKRIVREKIGVHDLADYLDCDKDYAKLEDGNFNKKDCKDCKHNGSEQKMLVETDSVKGKCLNVSCFITKSNAWIEKEKALLKKKGITVMDFDKVKELPDARQIQTYDDDHDKIVNNLDKKPEEFTVVFRKDDYNLVPNKEVWRIKKKVEKQTKEESTNEADKQLNLSRKEKLEKKVKEFKRDLLIETSQSLVTPGKAMKGVVLHYMLNRLANGYSEIKGIFKKDEKTLDQMTATLTKDVFELMGYNDLKVAATELGFDAEKHFKLTPEFCNLHTKDQLIKLAKEQSIDLGDAQKHAEIVSVIVDKWKDGQVPKVMLK